MEQREIEQSVGAIAQLVLGLALLGVGYVVFATPKGWVHWHWDALGTDKPVVAFECLDRWRASFNDPETVYIFDAVKLDALHEVDVVVRGKNRMGAFVKGEISCALKPDGSIDSDATALVMGEKMMRPEDGEVPP